MDPVHLRKVDQAPPAAPAAGTRAAAPGEFAALLRELEQAGKVPATTEGLGPTLAAAEDAFTLAMQLRQQLEQAFRTLA